MTHELFASREAENRKPIRPLGPLSDFVVSEMPMALAEIRASGEDHSLFASADVFATHALNSDAIADLGRKRNGRGFGGYVSTNHDAMIAHLDATMLEAALAQSGLRVPDSLSTLVNQLALVTDQPPCITYEGITWINPQTDPRTFLHERGSAHPIEYDFYRGHRIIDLKLGEAASHLRSLIKLLSREVQLDVQPDILLQQAQHKISDAVLVMQAYHDQALHLPFQEFRRYLNSHPTRGTKGPSGAFSAEVPELDILLLGQKLPDEIKSYVRDNFRYFSRQGRQELSSAYIMICRHHSLNDLLNGTRYQEAFDLIRQSMSAFRGMHRGAVEKQLPDVTTGTAGEQVGDFLSSRQKIHLK